MNFILKSLIKQRLKGVPEDQIDMLIAMVEKNPEFFQKLAVDIKAKTATGMSEEQAAQELMASYGPEFREMLKK